MRRRRSDVDRLLRWYPEAWRQRYGDEFGAFLEDHLAGRPPAMRFRLSIAMTGLRERAQGAGVVGRSSSPSERARTGALVVVCGWTAFVIAGASFAKLSEHFDRALPAGSRALPSAAYDTVQAVAVAAAALLVVGGFLALPAFARHLRGGGWPSVRRPLRRAIGLGMTATVVVIPIAAWAHWLSGAQRNGTDTGYSVVIVLWGLLVGTTLMAAARAACGVGRALHLSHRVLAAESLLAALVAGAMIAMTVATAIWWGAMATRSPWFLHGTAPGTGGSPFDLQLTATMLVMLAAVAVAAFGVARIGRSWIELSGRAPA